MVDVPLALDGPVLRSWVRDCVDAFECCRDEINELNVFPVADSDTGTNLCHTIRSAAEAVETLYAPRPDASSRDEVSRPAPSTAEVATALATGAVAGARGNSGVILSQVLRGIAAASGGGDLDAKALTVALGRALELVNQAVSTPVEGTIISVLRAASGTAEQVRDSADGLGVFVRAVAESAAAALERTPHQLAVLGESGAVDAGGRGLLVLLDCLVEVVTGARPARPVFRRRSAVEAPGRSGQPITTLSLARADEAGREMRPEEHCAAGVEDYEVMYLLDLPGDASGVPVLRERLEQLGNSVVIVGDGDGGWSVHVHCEDAGAAVEAGLELGRPRRIRITNFGLEEQARERGALPRLEGRAVLAVVTGVEAAELFAGEGAEVLLCDGPPGPADLLNAIVRTRVGEVVVLPNGVVPAEDLVAVGAAARDHGQQVHLLPCGSMVQGLASLAVHDPHRAITDDAYTMAEAAAGTRAATLRIAEERALTWAGTCEPGDALGMIGGEILVVEKRPEQAAQTLIDLMLGTGGELVTILTGSGASESLADSLTEHVRRNHPATELMLYPGGQGDDILQIGVE
ncbi:DAK2 domain-containing protein [Speluncibacter jeojiensis]|uniref:DAK2 domain-containing protein n=1 Tax=Speluncibacter jeojiensis TaxID=2710754 RepID=A0A9X4M0G9_9ACTN|nr:DAK2 domain-containing protein [Rhodococcus sp. D2-41]MDG3014037.1 DAK2 domain-containing protein [Corynebacteriales bacterium D3-21]